MRGGPGSSPPNLARRVAVNRKVFLSSGSYIVLLLMLALSGLAGPYALAGPSAFRNVRFFASPLCTQPLLISDRRVYYREDPVGHFVVGFCGVSEGLTNPNREIQLVLYDEGRTERQRLVLTAADITHPLFEFLLSLEPLTIQRYTVAATLRNRVTSQVYAVQEYAFDRTPGPGREDLFPADGIPIQIGPQALATDASWPVSTG